MCIVHLAYLIFLAHENNNNTIFRTHLELCEANLTFKVIQFKKNSQFLDLQFLLQFLYYKESKNAARRQTIGTGA